MMYGVFIAGDIVVQLYWVLTAPFGMMRAPWATRGGYVSYAAFDFDAYHADKLFFGHLVKRRCGW
jgi:hypothetical protein